MDALLESPFASVLPEDLEAVCEFPGFQILRDYLQNDLDNTFCARHGSMITEAESHYILHRDMLHAMIMPVVQLFKRACALAYEALCTRRQEDLELAFRGEARDVFVWLQCFVGEEDDWCHTRGCPACVVTHTLSTESTVRATIAAALLSATDYPSPPSTPSTESEASDYNTASSSPSLPDFTSTLPALHRALDSDPFWGPSYYSYIHARASRLAAAVQELIQQCAQLDTLLSAQPASPPGAVAVNAVSAVAAAAAVTDPAPRGKEMALKKGRMARRQSRLKNEEREVMMRMAWSAWAAPHGVGAGAARLAAREAARRARGERRRSLTCP